LLDLFRVLICIDFEVTELAALATKRDMDIEPKRIMDARRFVQRFDSAVNMFRFPLRKWRVIGNEIVSNLGLYFGRICG